MVSFKSSIFLLIDSSISADVKYEILSNPEFLAEGTAIDDLLNADRILIGGEQTESGLKAIDELSWVYEHWIAKEKVLTTNTWSSELSKLVSSMIVFSKYVQYVDKLCFSFSGGKRIFSPTDIKYKFIVGRLRGNRCRCNRSSKSCWP